MTQSIRRAVTVLAGVALAAASLEAGVKVKVAYDKAFNFATVRTFAWHPDGAGEVKVLSTIGDDPVQLNQTLEPMITPVIERELAKRGLVKDASGQPDLYLHYYLLIGPESESQYRGQFIGGVPAWGLPDFEMTTTSLKVAEHGTLVLDISSVAGRVTVWRGIASTEVHRQRTAAQRQQRFDEAGRELFKKFPPKYKPGKE
jgi:hypothetical protein